MYEELKVSHQICARCLKEQKNPVIEFSGLVFKLTNFKNRKVSDLLKS